jgi:hypothetical protein
MNCRATKQGGRPCRRRAMGGSELCHAHRGVAVGRPSKLTAELQARVARDREVDAYPHTADEHGRGQPDEPRPRAAEDDRDHQRDERGEEVAGDQLVRAEPDQPEGVRQAGGPDAGGQERVAPLGGTGAGKERHGEEKPHARGDRDAARGPRSSGWVAGLFGPGRSS